MLACEICSFRARGEGSETPTGASNNPQRFKHRAFESIAPRLPHGTPHGSVGFGTMRCSPRSSRDQHTRNSLIQEGPACTWFDSRLGPLLHTTTPHHTTPHLRGSTPSAAAWRVARPHARVYYDRLSLFPSQNTPHRHHTTLQLATATRVTPMVSTTVGRFGE